MLTMAGLWNLRGSLMRINLVMQAIGWIYNKLNVNIEETIMIPYDLIALGLILLVSGHT